MHRRTSSSSTVRAAHKVSGQLTAHLLDPAASFVPVQANLWIHDDAFSPIEVMMSPYILENSGIHEGDLVEVTPFIEDTVIRDFEQTSQPYASNDTIPSTGDHQQSGLSEEPPSKYLCIVRVAPPELISKHSGLEISMTRIIANAFGFRARTRVNIVLTDFDHWTASHIELSFRDAYLARSDMWRLVCQELAGKTVYRGQKISFLGTIKLTVRAIHVHGHHASTAYFSGSTIPVFRSEAARYVLFIQMSREMWDFDTEGNGEIMFNRVINGFLPDLFRRWVELEVRHLVSIVLFGRVEYDRYDFDGSTPTVAGLPSSSTSSNSPGYHQDFYHVVVTDIASAQWTTILNELKTDFRVFFRDITLHSPTPEQPYAKKSFPTRITGRPSTVLKGNILEAIHLASSQFANDYIDRDLIRTGISTIIITAGTGVFDVDRDLLNLTSENLTNNGIGIDIVCLSKMPLHSVPLFRYRLPQSRNLSRVESDASNASHTSTGKDLGSSLNQPSATSIIHSSAFSSFTSTSVNYFSRFPSAFPARLPQLYGYGIPQWIDLSYWSPDGHIKKPKSHKTWSSPKKFHSTSGNHFVPRVRMYELQMMGVMELGMADIAIPYLSETTNRFRKHHEPVQMELTQRTSRSLSQSPIHLRKAPQPILRQDSQGGIAARAKALKGAFDKMDQYDELIFHAAENKRDRSFHKKKSSRRKNLSNKKQTNEQHDHIRSPKTQSTHKHATPTETSSSYSLLSHNSQQTDNTVSSSNNATSPAKNARPPRVSRSISYALRGLMPTVRTAASASTSFENVKASPAMATMSFAQAGADAASLSNRAESVRSSDFDKVSYVSRDMDSRSVVSSDTIAETPSKPIKITASGPRPREKRNSQKGHATSKLATEISGADESQRTLTENLASSPEDGATRNEQDTYLASNSVPQSNLPFIRNVNASNPLKRHPGAASHFGRWQHLYPHKPRSSLVKWRSLCTPASVPLTTSDFPVSATALAEDYTTQQHEVTLKESSELSETPTTLDNLLFEMISLRLSHGYQIVVGDNLARVVGPGLCSVAAIMNPTNITAHGSVLFMTMGNTIQRLLFEDKTKVEVTKYVKKITQTEHPLAASHHYVPNVRTILSTEYRMRPIELQGFLEEYPWELADNHLADRENYQDEDIRDLRFWRTRFVLLPVEPPTGTWRPGPQNDETEEEIHLLGIRALTQIWQKSRYLPELERKVVSGRLGTVRRRDQNPLEIKFETLNPSEVVATELDKLLALEETGEIHTTRLLPEPERLDRHTPMSKIAQALQGERGIEIKNRRWHLRLHYNCFDGEELTNWLLHNIKNIETRQEAVEFGNQLMKEGLFEHVNSRHSFKDGNYFYSMKSDFRLPRIEIRPPWFHSGRRSDKSVPPTPSSEYPGRDPTPILTTRSRSGSSLALQFNPSTPIEPFKPIVERKKKTVSLSKMIRIDVDPRKRSGRPEIVNLHYDRLHNPENCYHIELSWLNVTSKLVDDAISTWTTQAEKYGLKLVEVPIAEACKVPESEPFRNVYTIKPCVDPPKRPNLNHNIFTTNSFAPQPSPVPDNHLYQKALLKRFNFVLDLEGVRDFPENVEIEYSWGRLEYRYTQFVHRSGVILAQITDDGNILLLANRLYNCRPPHSKDPNNRLESSKKDSATGGSRPIAMARTPLLPHQVSMQASGILGINVQSPRISGVSGLAVAHTNNSSNNATGPTSAQSSHPTSLLNNNSSSTNQILPTTSNDSFNTTFSPSPSPMIRATADVFGSKPAWLSSNMSTYITPEQIKDELESICHDATKLEQFYREVTASQPSLSSSVGGGGVANRPGGAGSRTSSSALGPIREKELLGVDNKDIPGLELPESVTTGKMQDSPASMSNNEGSGSGASASNDGFTLGSGTGSGFGGLHIGGGKGLNLSFRRSSRAILRDNSHNYSDHETSIGSNTTNNNGNNTATTKTTTKTTKDETVSNDEAPNAKDPTILNTTAAGVFPIEGIVETVKDVFSTNNTTDKTTTTTTTTNPPTQPDNNKSNQLERRSGSSIGSGGGGGGTNTDPNDKTSGSTLTSTTSNDRKSRSNTVKKASSLKGETRRSSSSSFAANITSTNTGGSVAKKDGDGNGDTSPKRKRTA